MMKLKQKKFVPRLTKYKKDARVYEEIRKQAECSHKLCRGFFIPDPKQIWRCIFCGKVDPQPPTIQY